MSVIIGCSIFKVEMGARCDIKETWSIQAAIAIATTFFSQRGFIKGSFDE